MRIRNRVTRSLAVASGTVVILFGVACGGGDTGEQASETSSVEVASSTVAAADVTAGHELFKANCGICHGENGEGMQGLGKNLNANAFVQGRSDNEVVAFLVEGRPASHPDNTQGVDMPPKGGNPALTEDDLQQIVTYLRSLQ